ncbi:hypothetical protein PT287_03170 [Lactobacillus sp. ESL0679]|uniref:hypothetical protein n=1 Tax=Lactobacillus sp. ESL0679 TaxID=2983209 RepID=UPI0023F69483|nr:hypothetical protein [Lactobacillus sp. ESL0679]MDF7682522.1 hypothetical protein [Lactobacillus sp. ESL0679]
MFTEMTLIFKRVSKQLSVPYKRLENKSNNYSLKNNTAFGGFTEQDWKNVGNDLKRGILIYGESRIK